MVNYKGSKLSISKHLETIYPSVARKVIVPSLYQTKRLELPDGDFLDYDFYPNTSEKVVIISHGLEGNSQRAYVLGMVKSFWLAGFNVVAWNYRSCSKEMNRNYCFYHSGMTGDLESIIKEVSHFKSIYLVGFSLGGNLTLKFLGENNAHKYNLKKAIVFSVPLHLKSSILRIQELQNFIYQKRFLFYLNRKVKNKMIQYPQLKELGDIDKIKNMYEFDEVLTAPLHGFKNADDYYEQSSSIYYVDKIKIQTCIVNALNDTLLAPQSLDPASVSNNPNIKLITPLYGGHCGFASFDKNHDLYWSEIFAVNFCNNQ